MLFCYRMMLIINVNAIMRYAFGQIDVLLTPYFSLFLWSRWDNTHRSCKKQMLNATIHRYFHVE
ncbi:hypothetical protein B7R70_10360 [Yersinia pseudotuberculosis]|uniref:Uncharacterized protein n=1 Tax=Yersinia pseudotuberculosis serotype I (strain IP32953) TaxID=273123 RepID=Q668Z1_YERPS|nr:hypothetical protein DN756_07560 [Yersinia pseudotuberculosis]CAH21834.1 hypothetical protein YPTB2596 [Yersinia pseudotuberculosis IP 32953]PSH12783.1 hypothetical protein B7R75_16285 [Yersinia pseudotuberculosis]PSH18067.1 hypothetical protein BLA52_12440 [Yersinia pseudotuberculosis]PSH24934.1 hypothetical protein BLA50_14510 [Yersinia pseudotuberculosis]